MPKKDSGLTASDGFCGAGGNGQAIEDAGVEIKDALNHWKLATETYATNFQNARVHCTDISACDPRRYESTDIAVFSPECTTHSPGGGNRHKKVKLQLSMYESGKIDPATERSRATMWDVCRFAEYHSYNLIFVENVVEAKTQWALFDNWLSCMHKLGYEHRCNYLNSMHFHPTPQSRDRMYIVFWKKGNKAPMLDYTPVAHCAACGKDVHSVQSWKNADKKYGKYRQQYVYCCPVHGTVVEPYYYAAFNCIDWSDKGTRIGDRAKPLAPNSVKRINYGLNKFGNSPFIFHHLYGKEARGVVRSVSDASFTQTTLPTQSVALPFIVKLEHSQRDNNVVSAGDAFSTQTVRQSGMLISNVRSAADSLQTQTTTQGMGFVVPPFIVENKGNSKSRSILQPLSTETTKEYQGIVTDESWNSFISYFYGGSLQASHVTEAIGTVTTNDRASLILNQQPNIEDCYYRMIKAPEVKLAMAFGREYKILGSMKDQVKQLGNAVTPPVMKWLIQQGVNSLK